MSEENKNESTESNHDHPFDVKTFAKYANQGDMSMLLGGFYNNPVIRNEILKQLTSSPVKYDREKVLKLVENPVHNEKALKDLAQYLLNNSNHFKRIVHHFGTILDFRHILVPLNPEKNKSFTKSYNKALEWLNKFDIKHEFSNIMKTIILEDAGFYYVRENGNAITLQRMPTDYCKIVDKTELGYQYAFNMVYFMKPYVQLDAFPPEFRMYYEEFLNGNNESPFYWKDLDPEKAFVFKWDENFAGIIPVLIGLYLDTVEIEEYKNLFKDKTKMENWKLLFQRIPMKEGDKADRNDFLIDPDIAGQFQKLIKGSLPQGTDILTSPMEISAINFEHTANSNNYVGFAEQNFFSSAGVSPILFGGAVNSSAGLGYSVQVDENFVTGMYNQFARFVNFQLSKVTGKYKFVVDFLDSTKFNKQQQFDNAMKVAPFGFPVELVAHGLGLKPNYLANLTAMENILDYKSQMKPLSSSYINPSGTEDAGAKKKSENDLSESGIRQRDEGLNENQGK